jgi:uncharacterized damage-inducible protein DinB
MAIIDGILAELDHEAQTTRRVLERVPGDRLAWQPHERARTLGALTMHVATVPGSVAALAAMASPAQIPSFVDPPLTDVATLLPTLDASVAKARRLLGDLPDATMLDDWRIVDGDRDVVVMPRAMFLRAVLLNHWYHHRGQLTVYLRTLGVPIPSIYGPSADENPFL